MQAIETKYFGPSNVKGSRIRATAQAGSVTVGYDHALNGDENHKAAAVKLMKKFSWKGGIVGGTLKSGNMVWVMTERKVEDTRCKVCGVEAAKHGYWAVDDPTTHMWKSK